MRQAIAVLVMLAILLLFGCTSREQRLMREGDALVARIDSFQANTGRLPANLAELGIEEELEGPLYYQKFSAEQYIVYFGTAVGESMIYRSETQSWADH